MLAICGKGKGAETTEATNNGLLLNTLKTLFRLSRVLLDLKKCILSSTIKFLSVLSSLANWRSFRNYNLGFSIIFWKILDVIKSFIKARILLIPLSITFSNPKMLGSFFYEI